MKYLYTPYDIAVFFISADFSLSDEKNLLSRLSESADIPSKYRGNYPLLKKQVANEISNFDNTLDAEINALQILLKDVDRTFKINGIINEQGVIESYFKIIKLWLTFVEGCAFRKIKLRTLLKHFGYKRRSLQLVNEIESTLKALELKTFVRNHIACKISEADIDDMIIIRV